MSDTKRRTGPATPADRPAEGGEPPQEPGWAPLLDEQARADRLAFYEIGERDAELLQLLAPACEGHLDPLIADFYAHLLRFPPLEALLRDEPGRVAKLQGLQRNYFQQLVAGKIDADYFESRLRVGNAHQRIGVRPEWYIGAFSLFLRLWLRVLGQEIDDRDQLLRSFESIVKLVFLDMSLAIDTYIHGGFVDRETALRLERTTAIAEEALRAREATEQLKDDLTTMVVHDLKNPVNGIAMMVQLALRKAGDLPPAHRGYLEQIDRTCREMMRLIQNLLEISKIEEGKMPVEHDVVSPAEIAAEVAREYGPVAEQAGRTLRTNVAAGTPPVAADRALVKRVLVNLVTNALRHSGSAEVRVEATSDTTAVTVRVVDRGTGISPEDAARLFEKFRSMRPSPSDAPGGDTGLGLTFCKLAVELMGGSIGVHSLPGAETVFWITLPLAEE